MPTIDADAHVIETPETWSYFTAAEKPFTPMVVSRAEGGEDHGVRGNAIRQYWAIDGRMHDKESNIGAETPQDAREMRDIPGRLRQMDELEIDIQILYPTLFLRPLTTNAAVEYALCRSYNRWLADIWRQAPERLRWVAMPPLLSMGRVRDELVFAKENGAVGIFMRGLECERPMSDPYFYPLYETAGELDLAICVHSATNSFQVYNIFHNDPGFNKFKLATIGAVHSLLWHGIPERFPKLRWGFVEVSAQWIPYLLNDLRVRLAKRDKTLSDSVLADNNIYVACQVTDDLDYVLTYAGEDTLVIGTDYGHHDTATEIEALRMLRADGRVPPTAAGRILDDNPRSLYGLG